LRSCRLRHNTAMDDINAAHDEVGGIRVCDCARVQRWLKNFGSGALWSFRVGIRKPSPLTK
jgi:hypothetical protein